MLPELIVDQLSRAGTSCEIFDVVPGGQYATDGENIVQNRRVIRTVMRSGKEEYALDAISEIEYVSGQDVCLTKVNIKSRFRFWDR